jgi:hypothetical protein
LDACSYQNAWFPRFPPIDATAMLPTRKNSGADVHPERNRKRSQDSILSREDKGAHQEGVKDRARRPL